MTVSTRVYPIVTRIGQELRKLELNPREKNSGENRKKNKKKKQESGNSSIMENEMRR